MARKKGRTIESYEKDQRALDLRKEGHTYESISEQLGYSTPSASYKSVMRRLKEVDRPAVSMLRELEVQRLGHASVTITLDTYSHVIPGLQEERPRSSRRSSPMADRTGSVFETDVARMLPRARFHVPAHGWRSYLSQIATRP